MFIALDIENELHIANIISALLLIHVRSPNAVYESKVDLSRTKSSQLAFNPLQEIVRMHAMKYCTDRTLYK